MLLLNFWLGFLLKIESSYSVFRYIFALKLGLFDQ